MAFSWIRENSVFCADGSAETIVHTDPGHAQREAIRVVFREAVDRRHRRGPSVKLSVEILALHTPIRGKRPFYPAPDRPSILRVGPRAGARGSWSRHLRCWKRQ